MSSPLPPGTLIASRFSLAQPAGRGGMGFVYRAQDLLSGHTVALKLMHAASQPDADSRFEREAQVLAELRHPGIVSYLAHGLSQDGQPFLAMEWLEGEDLAQRLAREPLSVTETLLLLRGAADALAAAHARGIVHRDIKPSNLFLRGRKADAVVLLDFGLARIAEATRPLTGSAVILGTPGYMAPEQASCSQDLTPSVDVFSLGCVLYECLTGQPPFQGSHMAAVLAKILFSEPAPLRTLRPELPASLQELLERMLAKEPSRRIADARQLLHALEALEVVHEAAPPQRREASAGGLASAEQHLVSVLLATSRRSSGDGFPAQVLSAEQASENIRHVRQELEAQGARTALLADGSLLATFLLDRGTATDLANLAARCALSIKERLPDKYVVLSTGLSLRDQPLPVGDVMDRAGELLRHLEQQPLGPTSQVLMDDTTAGLLGPRFQSGKSPSGAFLLQGEHLSVDESRPLLGRPTPCVGREQELALLELAFTSCVEDSSARALLVTGPAGTGKSRLRHEFLRRLGQRGSPPLVLVGSGDPMNALSAYGLVGLAVRRLCGVVDGEPPEARRASLTRRVARHLPPDQVKDTVAFLGELCGVTFSSEEHPKLRAAREDPRLMSAQVTRALVAFLQAELTQGPVLLILEDLHWGDAATVRVVGEALRELSDSPLLVLALARPEVRELFPDLWGTYLQEVPLRGLNPKAGARLVREVLGPQVPEAVATRLVEQAAGNVLFLEELIRGMAEGRGEETPGTVLAMLQHRIQRLEPGPRRVLMAASIFGRSFWQEGVRALLDRDSSSSAELEHHLRLLVELEMVQLQPGSRFPAEAEYRFRHALLRDASYSLVPAALKPRGHALAGAWLEQAGEQDPMLLAEHYQLGQQQERAVHFLTRASEWLFKRQDLQGARRCLESAMAYAPTGAPLAALRALESSIHFWMDDFARAYALGQMVLPELSVGSAPWCRIIGEMFIAGSQSGQHADLARLGQLLAKTTPEADAAPLYLEAAAFLVGTSTWFGRREAASAMRQRMETVATAVQARDGRAWGWMYSTRGYFYHFLDERPWEARRWAEEGVRAFLEVGWDPKSSARLVLGLALAALGEVSEAIDVLREGLEAARRVGQGYVLAQMHLMLTLAGSAVTAHQEEAYRLADEAVRTHQVNPLHRGTTRLALARVAAFQGRFSEAEQHAVLAREALEPFLPYQLLARTQWSAALLAQQRVAEARTVAEAGVEVLRQMGGVGAASVATWLALAEACLAQGDTSAGEEALRQAVRSLRLRAEDIPDAAARERFFRQVPENARTRELAIQRWGEGWGQPIS